VSSFDPSVAETRSTLPLPKFFMESPDSLELIQEPVKTLSLCSNTEGQSRVGQRLQPAKPAASAIVARHTKPSIEKRVREARNFSHCGASTAANRGTDEGGVEPGPRRDAPLSISIDCTAREPNRPDSDSYTAGMLRRLLAIAASIPPRETQVLVKHCEPKLLRPDVTGSM
jgi:hypothetical protein